MTSLRRLLKRKFLSDYLELACRSGEIPCSVAVVADGQTLAAAGEGADALSPDDPGAVSLPLRTSAGTAGHLILKARAADGGAACERTTDGRTTDERTTERLQRQAELLARSLQALVEVEEARRAVSTEALVLYRELSLLHRAAVALNDSLQQTDVGEALLAEFKRGTTPAEAGMVLCRSPSSGNFEALCSFGGDAAKGLAGVARSRLFGDIVEAGKGEIVNDLAADSRWDGEVPGMAAALVIPLMSHDHCAGVLVLATADVDKDFSAGDLRQAATLASAAAAALRNAVLFEEVVEVKNYNENVLQNLSNGVVTLDGSRCITMTNEAALRILRRAGEDLVGRTVDEVFGDENDWVLTSVEKVMETASGEVWVDKEIKVGDETISVNFTVVPLTNLERQTIGYILVLEDITREKRIKGTMVRFMSDTVVQKLMDADESLLGGSAQEVTVLFSDIRRFTAMSEAMSARDMVGTLNDYFTEMVDVIFDHGGTLDKFIGDAIMAIFGAPFVAPDDTDNAVGTAIEMMERLRVFNAARVVGGKPEIDIGVGINTGSVVAGTIGSPKRMDYTVIGDHVNLAARIESANKYFGTKILMSEHTLEMLRRDYRCREIDRVRVPGRTKPVAVYEVLDYHTDQTFPGLDEALSAFEKGLAHYRRREWEKGAACFADALKANPNDRPTQIFLHRCWSYMARPPDDSWAAVTDVTDLTK